MVEDGGAAEQERREKNRATFVSVGASLFLACIKLVVGILTGSLGLLAEAAHSGLDFVASLITFVSVRVARRPADQEHPYGHERFENLSAVIQGVLLLGTAVWIAYEAALRLFFESVRVQPTPAAFGVMIFAIATDLWRSRILWKVARKYRSRALEADALNFRADLLSSVAVLLGLALVAVGEVVGRAGFLSNADAVAALVVAGIIVYKAGGLLLSSLNVLLDRAPAELEAKVRSAASSVPGVVEATSVRLRESGSRTFADVVVTVPRAISAPEAHEITERVEKAVRDVDPRAESVVHTEPVALDTETLAESIHATALQMGLRTHHERVQRSGDRLEASLHLEVDPGLTLGEAHALANRLGREVRERHPHLSRVNTHIEVAEPEIDGETTEVTVEHPGLASEIKQVAEEAGEEARCHEVRLYLTGGSIDAVLHCDFPGSENIGAVHVQTERMEQAVRERFPELGHIVIHAEPRV
jgi:cation diffusion facilitator family transporter